MLSKVRLRVPSEKLAKSYPNSYESMLPLAYMVIQLRDSVGLIWRRFVLKLCISRQVDRSRPRQRRRLRAGRPDPI